MTAKKRGPAGGGSPKKQRHKKFSKPFFTPKSPSIPFQNAALEQRVDEITQEDRRFFESHPDRRHRVRPTEPEEIRVAALVLNTCIEPLPPGTRRFTLVRKLFDHERLRTFAVFPEYLIDEEISESAARELFDQMLAAQGGRS
jgi:hypothetical protein